MSPLSTLLYNARKVDADGITDDFWMATEGSKIIGTGTGTAARPETQTTIDAGGQWLTPGFIDIHCHGGAGFSFSNDADKLGAALEPHRLRGTTRSVISLVSDSIESMARSLGVIANLHQRDSRVLGSHIEGPFLSEDFRGAHDATAIRSPNQRDVQALLEAADGTMVQVTIAPELSGADAAIRMFLDHDVRVAVGHSGAGYTEAKRAFNQGATILTHAFNAMRPIRNREPGPVIAAFDDARVTLEFILDGFHSVSPIAQLAFREAPGRVALVTDAMAAAGAGDGDYRLGSLDVSVSRGQAMVMGTETLAGSTLTQDVALRLALQKVGLTPVEAVTALTMTPSRALGLHKTMGLLRKGFVADAVLLDSNWRVEKVWAEGKPIL